jgi:photosystem II stability/assembly factor-like uncharacterized protein
MSTSSTFRNTDALEDNMNKFLLRIFAALFVGLFPVLANAQFQADLTVENFSVYSTLPDSSGFRRVSVSFRVVNRGRSSAKPSTTRVTFDNNVTDFATPGLNALGFFLKSAPAGTAYITRVTRSTASQIAVTIQADALNAVAENNETNNRLPFTAVLTQQSGRWLSIGPSKIQDPGKTFGDTFGVGRVTTIAVDPRSPTIIYAGARGSGLWKSFTAGSIWFPIGDSLPTVQIDAIGIYPKDPNRVVIATPEGVFESRDEGSLWTQLTSDDLKAVGSGGGALLIANSINPALYVSTKGGLRVSTDGGHTWPTVPLPGSPEGFPAPQVISLQFSTADPSHLFASTANPPGVFEAKEGGLKSASWHMLTGCVPPLPSFPANSTVWIAESGIHKWVSFRAKTAVGNIAELWRSTSRICQINGFTEQAWEKVPLGDTCGKFGNNFSYLFAHPNDPSIVFKGGQDLCRSTQSGSKLTPVSGIHLDHHAIAVAPSAPGLMFFGTDGGVYRSVDKGKTMEFISEGLSNTEFLKIDTDGKGPRFVVGASQDNFTSTWNGVSPIWNMISGGNTVITDSSLVAFDRADMTGVYEIGQSTGQVRLIKPGGGSVKLGDSSLPDCKTYDETPMIFASMASTGGNPRLLITCQGIWSGPPWKQIQPVPAESQADFTRLRLHPSGVLVAVTDKGEVFHGIFNQPPPALRKVFQIPASTSPECHPPPIVTPLPRASPTPVLPKTPVPPSAITFAGPGRFYISSNPFQRGRIDRLDCFIECQHETVCMPDLGEITAMTVDPLAPDTLFAAIRNRGVFRGVRNAPNDWTWSEFNNGLPVAVTVTDLQPQASGGIIAATFGRGAFRLFSKIEQRPPNPTARGRITSYENKRADPDRPPGPNNQMIETIEIDSRPGFLFTATSPTGRFRFIAQRALRDHRIVTIEFTPISAQSGKIISMR